MNGWIEIIRSGFQTKQWQTVVRIISLFQN